MERKDESTDRSSPLDYARLAPTSKFSVEELSLLVTAVNFSNDPTPGIGTKGMFPMMELPSELRLEVRCGRSSKEKYQRDI